MAMPGPPAELEEMWRKEVQPSLRQRTKDVILSKTFKTFGLSEAAVGELVSPLFSLANPILGIYAKTDGIHLRFIAKAKTPEKAAEMLTNGEANIRKVVGEHIWGMDNDTLETVVGRLLIEKGLSLASLEDYSGGWLATSVTDVPDSPEFFKGGLVAQSSEAKIAFGVGAEIISHYGAFSPEVAQAMAEAARAFFRVDIGIGMTGVDEALEPMGIVYIGIANGKKSRVMISRSRNKRRAATAALFELRKWLI